MCVRVCVWTNRLFAVTASMCERNRGSGAVFESGMGEPEEGGGEGEGAASWGSR